MARVQITLRKIWHQLRWPLAAAVVPIIAVAAYLAIDTSWPHLGDPWIKIERIQANWRPMAHQIEVFRIYTKDELCPGNLGWDVWVEEASSGLLHGPFRRYTMTTQVGKRVYGAPLDVPWENEEPPVRVAVEVRCVELTDEGLIERNDEYPPQKGEVWVPVSGSAQQSSPAKPRRNLSAVRKEKVP